MRYNIRMSNPIAAACLALSLVLPPLSQAQLRWPAEEIKVWVVLKDKGPGTGALARTSRRYENLAVHEPYVEALRAQGFACETRLKWQNRVSGRVHPSALSRLSGLSFVTAVSELPRKVAPRRPAAPAPWLPGFLQKPSGGAGSPIPDLGVYKALADTLHVTEVLDWMEKSGIRPGLGVRIAVMDADFDLGHKAFDPIRSEGRIKDQFDFVDNKPQVVTSDLADSHGAQCLSLIAGFLPGKIVAAAPEAEFLLYRTEESAQERYAEEDFLAAAIERAVDSGAHVISISVVYRTEFDSTPDIPLSQLDGRTRPSSVAALGAARRNVLLVSAMGNLDGNQTGPSTLSVPSDADSIIAVGIVNRAGGPCGYSTTGPTADGRVKPELVSMGLIGTCSVDMANTSTREGILAQQGTSFAAPVIAGIAALLRQARPTATAQEIRASLLATARNSAQPNSQIGWGLPDAWAALGRPMVSVRRWTSPLPLRWQSAPRDVTGRTLPAIPAAAGIRF